MQFRIGFGEMQNLISQKSGKNISMLYGGTHTVRIGYDVTILFKTTNMGLDINVEGVEGEDVLLSYGGGAGIEFAVKQALAHIKNQPAADLLEIREGNRLVLHLGKSPQMSPIFERVTLRDIFFDEQFAIIDFVPKM